MDLDDGVSEKKLSLTIANKDTDQACEAAGSAVLLLSNVVVEVEFVSCRYIRSLHCPEDRSS